MQLLEVDLVETLGKINVRYGGAADFS